MALVKIQENKTLCVTVGVSSWGGLEGYGQNASEGPSLDTPDLQSPS